MNPPETQITFEAPPVNEVSFAIQFRTNVIDEVGTLSSYWPTVQVDYPNVEKQAPVPPMRENFDYPPQPGGPDFEFLSSPPSPRYWFSSADGTLLIQIQPDRFMFNWRQVAGDEDYPRFAALFPEFLKRYEEFVSMLLIAGVEPEVAWCELTYHNPIPVDSSDGTHGQLANIVTFIERDPGHTTIPPVEDTQLQQRFRLADASGTAVGRMYITAVPGFLKNSSTPVYVLALIVRARPEADGEWSGVGEFFQMAHRLIVHGFAEVTRPELHERWGRKDTTA